MYKLGWPYLIPMVDCVKVTTPWMKKVELIRCAYASISLRMHTRPASKRGIPIIPDTIIRKFLKKKDIKSQKNI